MKVLIATSELAPIARVGGLAEATSGLVCALREQGVDLEVVLADYAPVGSGDGTPTGTGTPLPGVPGWAAPARVREVVDPHVGPVTLVHSDALDRPHPYTDENGWGWVDNDRRFLGFSAAVAALIDRVQPDVVHLNDWHTAAVPAFLKRSRPTVLTIHTLAHQGVCTGSWLERLRRLRSRYERGGVTNPLAGGLASVDRVVAVSPSYADEITRPGSGCGLDDLLGGLGDRLIGIRNGIDTVVWNPATDPNLAATFHASDLGGRDACRRRLIEECGWGAAEVGSEPLIGMVTRLVDQKGIDLVLDVSRFLGTIGARLVVLGSGERHLEDALAAVAAATPTRINVRGGYDDGFAHRVFAGSDLFLMPSRFEPCGLGQMQAMRYGSIPVVTPVGGLLDTVFDADAHPETGNGIMALGVDGAAVLDGLQRGVRLLHGPRHEEVRRRGMTADWSWRLPAGRYRELYADLVDGSAPPEGGDGGDGGPKVRAQKASGQKVRAQKVSGRGRSRTR